MDTISIFAVIAGIIFIGYIAELIFLKTKIPDVLLLICLGIGIGTGLNWATAESFGSASSLFTTFALIFILFQGALSIDFNTLLRTLSETIYLTLISFILTVTIVTSISIFLGFTFPISLLIGFILGGTSSAVVIPLVQNIEISNKYGLVLTLESAISDVLCIIGTITIIEIIKTGEIVASGVFRSVLSSFSLALVVGSIVGIIWIFVLYYNEILLKSYMLTIAVVIGLYAFVESPFVKASGAIAALAFGLVLGNSKFILASKNKKIEEKKERNEKKGIENDEKIITNVLSTGAKNFYSEISFFVKTFFFVYLGILIDFSNPGVLIYGALLSFGIFLIRPLAVKIAIKGSNSIEIKEKVFLETIIPKGLAAAVLAGIAVQSGILGADTSQFINMILSVVLISIALTSVLVFATEKGWFKGFMFFLNTKKN